MLCLWKILPSLAVLAVSAALAADLVEQSPQHIVLRNTAGIQDVYDTAQAHCARYDKKSWAEWMNADASVYEFICA